MTTPATPAADAQILAAWSKHAAVNDYPDGYSVREHVLRAGRELATSRESALVAERDALRADAERYRYLRLKVYVDPKELILRIRDVFLASGATVPDMFDAAIDESRALAAPAVEG